MCIFNNVQFSIQIFRHGKKQKHETHMEKKRQLIETGSEYVHTLGLPDKDFKTAITNIVQ